MIITSSRRGGISGKVILVCMVAALLGILAVYGINHSLDAKRQETLCKAIDSYSFQVLVYMGTNVDLVESSLNGMPVEAVIEVGEWYRNKMVLENGKIVGLKNQFTEKERKWLQDHIKFIE